MTKRNYIIIIWCMLALPLMAQVCPDWYESTSRYMHYPRDLYYSGFAIGEQDAGESLDVAINRLKDEARIEAASSIRMTVEKQMTTLNRSELHQTGNSFDEQITEFFESASRTNVSMEIPGLKTEVWQKPQSKTIAAFAYVSRRELIEQSTKLILTTHAKIEILLDNVDEQKKNGEKVQARNVLSRVEPLLKQVEQSQLLLASIDAQTDDEAMQLSTSRLLQQRFNSLRSELKNGINVMIICEADLFGLSFLNLKKELQGELSKLGCNFVNSPDDADWLVAINAEAREYNATQFGNVSQYTAIVDAMLTIDKTSTSQRIYEDNVEQKGVHTLNYGEAARQAYKEIGSMLSKVIKQQIQQ